MGFVAKIAVLGAVSALCANLVKKQTPEVALVLSLCGVTLILTLAFAAFVPIRAVLDSLAERAGLSSAVLSPVVRTVGIALLTRITAELCRDGGESGLASAVEIAGSAGALAVCTPLLEAVLQTVLELL